MRRRRLPTHRVFNGSIAPFLHHSEVLATCLAIPDWGGNAIWSHPVALKWEAVRRGGSSTLQMVSTDDLALLALLLRADDFGPMVGLNDADAMARIQARRCGCVVATGVGDCGWLCAAQPVPDRPLTAKQANFARRRFGLPPLRVPSGDWRLRDVDHDAAQVAARAPVSLLEAGTCVPLPPPLRLLAAEFSEQAAELLAGVLPSIVKTDDDYCPLFRSPRVEAAFRRWGRMGTVFSRAFLWKRLLASSGSGAPRLASLARALIRQAAPDFARPGCGAWPRSVLGLCEALLDDMGDSPACEASPEALGAACLLLWEDTRADARTPEEAARHNDAARALRHGSPRTLATLRSVCAADRWRELAGAWRGGVARALATPPRMEFLSARTAAAAAAALRDPHASLEDLQAADADRAAALAAELRLPTLRDVLDHPAVAAHMDGRAIEFGVPPRVDTRDAAAVARLVERNAELHDLVPDPDYLAPFADGVLLWAFSHGVSLPGPPGHPGVDVALASAADMAAALRCVRSPSYSVEELQWRVQEAFAAGRWVPRLLEWLVETGGAGYPLHPGWRWDE